jgi:hypothetical protein
MLSATVYRDLTITIQNFDLIQRRLREGAPPSEIDLLVEAAQDRVRRLAESVNASGSRSVGQLLRHLSAIAFFHSRGEPERYAVDIEDINVRDLPGVVDEVARFEAGLLSSGLVEAVSRSGNDRNYVNVVRDAFVYLEQALRGAGRVSTTDSTPAVPLINRLLKPDSPGKIPLPGEARSGSELEGVHLLFSGAFQVFRNPASHRPVEFDVGAANEILGLVDLCLRILGTEEKPALHVRLNDGIDVDQTLAALEEVAGRNPGPSLVWVHAAGRLPDEEPTALNGRVAPTRLLRAELRAVAGVRSV